MAQNPLSLGNYNLQDVGQQRLFLNNLSTMLSDIQASINGITAKWTAFTATLSSQVGAISAQSSNSAYLQMGKTVFLNINVTASNIGTASGYAYVTIPFAPTRQCVFFVHETAVNGLGYTLTFAASSSTGLIALSGTGGVPQWANGVTYSGMGVLEMAA